MRTFFGKTPTAPSYGFVKFRYDAQAAPCSCMYPVSVAVRADTCHTCRGSPLAHWHLYMCHFWQIWEALAAIGAMNGREFNGHTMTVRLANNDTTGPHPRQRVNMG